MRNVDVNIIYRLLVMIHMVTVSLTLLQLESLQKQVRVLLLKEPGCIIQKCAVEE